MRLPKRLPLARAFRRFASTRCAIRLHSSLAIEPSTVNTILPGVAFRSTFWEGPELLQADLDQCLNFQGREQARGFPFPQGRVAPRISPCWREGMSSRRKEAKTGSRVRLDRLPQESPRSFCLKAKCTKPWIPHQSVKLPPAPNAA